MEKNEENKAIDDDAKTTMPREKLIKTAVSFLLNPRVFQSEISHKTYFLKNKGLNDEEIDIAIKRSELKMPHYNANQSVQEHGTKSFTSKLQTYSSFTVVMGTSLYLFYRLYQKYFLPYFLGIPREKNQLSKLEESVNYLQETLTKLDFTFSSFNAKLDLCCSGIDSMKQSSNLTSSDKMEDLKKEIGSLKGLLLNRRQFPPAPVNSPAIPSWQLEKSTATDNVSSDEVEEDKFKEVQTSTSEDSFTNIPSPKEFHLEQ